MPDDFLTAYIKSIKPKPASTAGPDVSDLLERVRPAVFGQESSSNYQVRRNPRTQATGGFQVMPANIGPWTQTHVGRRMTQDEFERDPNAQEKVFAGEFGKYLRNARAIAPDDDTAIRMAAAAWYGGEDDMKRYDDPTKFRPNEPSFREYTSSVLKRTKNAAAPSPLSFLDQYVKTQTQPPAPQAAEDFTTAYVRSTVGGQPAMPTNPTDGTTPVQPFPETPSTIGQQLISLRDANSPKAGVLLTDPGQESLFKDQVSGFKRVPTPQGILYVNPTKAKAMGLTDYKNNVAALIGKVEPTEQTQTGPAVLTTDANGTELSASRVSTPEAAQAQAQVDAQSYPQAANTQVVDAQDVVAKRAADGSIDEESYGPVYAANFQKRLEELGYKLGQAPPDSYHQFLTDTGLPDTPDSQKEFQTVQKALAQPIPQESPGSQKLRQAVETVRSRKGTQQPKAPKPGATTFGREVGTANEELDREIGETVVDVRADPKTKLRQAMIEQLGRYDVTPQQVDAYLAGPGANEIAKLTSKPTVSKVAIAYRVLRDIAGDDAAKYALRSEQAQGRTNPNVGIDMEVSPDKVYERLGYTPTADQAKWLNSNAGTALTAINPMFAFLDKDQRDNIGASLAGGFLGSGARGWRALAGIARPINTDLYDFMADIAKTGESLEARTGDKGIASTVAKLAGGAPGDLSRLYLFTRLGSKVTGMGGVIVGFAADSGLQSSGRGDDLGEIAKQTGKGAALGTVFAAAPTIGRLGEWAVKPGSALAREASTVATIGLGSAQVEKWFGSTDEQALHTGVINSLFHLANVAGRSLVNKTIRARDSKGNETKVGVTPEGEIKLLRGAKDIEPDIEMYFDEKSQMYKAPGDTAPVRAKEEPYSVGNRGNRLETSQEPDQLAENNPTRIPTPDPAAIQKVSIDTRARKIVDALRDKDFVTLEEAAKAAKVNKVLAEDTIMQLYGAGMIEMLPGNRIRLINEAAPSADLFERAKTYGQTPAVQPQQPPVAKKPLVPTQQPASTVPEQTTGKTVSESEPETSAVQTTETVAPDIQTETAQRYETLPEQKPQEAPVEKPKAKVITAERPDTAKLLQVFTERGTKASIEPKVIDAKDILTSLDEGYPKEFQPRDRSRIASRAQISEIANKLNPEFLGDSPKASDGRPLVVPVEMPDGSTKYAVISGNGRTAAIREAYNAGNEGSKRYSEFASGKSGGKDAGIMQPVYVGQLDPKEVGDLAEFAREANESSVATMSATEQAKADAERLTPDLMAQFVPADDGSIHSAANRDFTRAFLDAIGTNEQARLVMPDGSLNQDGVNRVRNAIFAKAFGETEKGTAAIQRMAESTNDSVKNVTTAMLGVSGPLAAYKEAAKSGTRHNEYEISNDIAAAVAEYAKLKSPDSAFKDLTEYISQGNLFGSDTTPFQTRLMQVLDANKRSPKAIRTIFSNFLQGADTAGDPNQANLFAGDDKLSVESLFEGAVKAYERTAARQVPSEPAGLFEDKGLRREGEPEARQASSSVSDQETRGREERPRTESVELKAKTAFPESIPASEIPANQPEPKTLPPLMQSVVRRAKKDASDETIADYYDLDVEAVQRLRAITDENVGRFGQTSYYIRKALSPDDMGKLINKLAKQTVPQARIHVNNPLFDRQGSINVILDTLASEAGKLRSSEMSPGDWKQLILSRELPQEFKQIVVEATAHQEDWFRRRQGFKDDRGVADLMDKVAELADLPGGLEQLARVEWGNQQKSTLPQDIKKAVRDIGKKYGLSEETTKKTFLEAVRRTAQEELGRRDRERADRPGDAETQGETEQPTLTPAQTGPAATDVESMIRSTLSGLSQTGVMNQEKFGSIKEKFAEYGSSTVLHFGGKWRPWDAKPTYYAAQNFSANAGFRDVAGSTKLTKEYNAKRKDKIHEFSSIDALIQFATKATHLKTDPTTPTLDDFRFAFGQTDLFGNPVSDIATQDALFDFKPAPPEQTPQGVDPGTFNFLVSLRDSKNKQIARDADALVQLAYDAERSAPLIPIVDDAASALDLFSRSVHTKTPINDMLRQGWMGTQADISERASDFARAMASKGFPQLLNKAIAEAKMQPSLGDFQFMVAGEGDEFRTETPEFFSQLERTIEQKMPKSATADQVRGIIKDTKQDERDWLGIDQFLTENPKVTKAELLDFVKANQVQLEEVEKGGANTKLEQQIEELKAQREELLEDEDGDNTVEIHNLTVEIRELNDQINRGGRNETKFSQYTLPGGENYRELLLTMPNQARAYTHSDVREDVEHAKLRTATDRNLFWFLSLPDNRTLQILKSEHPTLDDAIDYVVRNKQPDPSLDIRNYVSSHWSEPNVLAHIRFDERTVDDRRVMHVAEIQSDWHQEGRKKGYQGDSPYFIQEDDGEFVVKSRTDPNWNGGSFPLRKRAEAFIQTRLSWSGDVVPDAPFKKSWQELAFKKALRYAVENNFDAISWDTGDTNAERYDLSKQVDYISAETQDGQREIDVHPLDGGEVFNLNVDDTGKVVSGTAQFVGKPLDDVVGKELAEKIMATEEPIMLKGNDLKVGGSGMRGFYDKMLPTFAQKYVKKWGGKVQTGPYLTTFSGEPKEIERVGGGMYRVVGDDGRGIRFDDYEDAKAFAQGEEKKAPIHVIKITPAMRESVMQGQPLFSLSPSGVGFNDRLIGIEQKRFGKDVDNALDGSMGRYEQAEVMSAAPPVLRRLGLRDAEIMAPQAVIHKAIEKHQIPAETIKQLPTQLNDPVMVFESVDDPKRIAVLTDLFNSEGKPIVVIIDPRGKDVRADVNVIPSIQRKTREKFVFDWARLGKLRYQNKEKRRNWFQNVGLQLPELETNLPTNSKILTEADFVKRNDVQNDRPGALRLAREIDKLRSTPNATPERLAIAARAKVDDNAVLTINPAGAALLMHSIEDLTGQRAGVFTGFYAKDRVAPALANKLLSTARFNRSPEYRRFAQSVVDAFNKTGASRDLTVVVQNEQSTEASKFTRQEELTHRANARSGAKMLFINIADTPSIRKGIEKISTRGYSGIPLVDQVDEVIAKSHREDAEAELGLSDAEVRANLKAFWNASNDAGIDLSEHANISPKAREVYESQRRERDVATQPQRAEIRDTRAENNEAVRREGGGRSPRPRPFREDDRFTGLERAGLFAASRGETEELATRQTDAIANEIRYALDYQKAKNVAVDILGAPRAIKASSDLSAAGRQGLILLPANPIIAGRAFLKQFEMLPPKKGHEAYERFKRDLDLHPFIELAEESGLYLASLHGASISAKEEAFMSRLMGDDPYFKNRALEKTRQFVTFPVRGSERAYTAFLDKLRIDVFTKLSRQLGEYNARKGREHNIEGFKALAKFINYATGRGDLGMFNEAAPLLGQVFFSPRFWASRLQVMNPLFYAKLPPGARGLVFKNMAAFVGAVALVTVLLKAAGFDVEMGDEDNPDLMKLRLGNYRYDFTAGLIGHLRYIGRMAKASTGLASDPKTRKKALNDMSYLTGRYLRSKFSPNLGAAVNAAYGENFIKEPTSLREEAIGLTKPIMLDNFREAFQAEGVLGLIKTSPEFFGIGASRYRSVEELRKQIDNERSKLKEDSTAEDRQEIARRIKLWQGQIEKAKKSELEDRKAMVR
jgi:hypothetical protein